MSPVVATPEVIELGYDELRVARDIHMVPLTLELRA
jgi:hypothetical protein